ncbi:MAG: hypothetical protein N2Z40_01435 [Caldimicrobium sp.]|nr:hypothetical protein [Caldimicrobium sp.]MCX7612873.1 hypothetical protein [Caldimicrobium sp.]MDW8183599.1 hypothetical protein [Caldimicrobium sp.]
MQRILFVLTLGFIIFLGCRDIHALTLKEIQTKVTPEGFLVVSAMFHNFPTQELLLSLKRQKGEIVVIYEFEVLRDRRLGADLLQREIYFQKAGYIPEKNQYFFEDNWDKILYNSAEEVIPKLSFLSSYPLDVRALLPISSGTYLLVKVTLRYRTHLNEDLRNTSKEREVILKTAKRHALY